MNVENLTIMGTGFTQTQPVGSCGRAALYGIWFNGAGGSVTNVTVTGITEGSNCQVGRAIVGNGTAGETLTITGTTVSDYNKDAMHAYGMTMNVSGSTIDPPASLKGITGQNGLVYQDGASGTTSDSTIFGSGYGNANNANTAVLLFGATNVTLSGDTITGDGTDIGVAVAANSTGAVIDGNQIGRTAPDVADNFGFGVEVDSPSSTATLSCNTFSGWIEDIVGVPPQPGSVRSPPLRPMDTGWPPPMEGYSPSVRPPSTAPRPTPHSRPGGRDGRHDRRRLLAGGFGRQRVLARRADRLGSLSGQHPTHPSWAWRRRRTGSATTWWVPTGACSPSATPTSGLHGRQTLNKPVVGIAVTPTTRATTWWPSDGGVFTFGDAHFQGSMGGKAAQQAGGRRGRGYGYGRLLADGAADGGIFAFDAPFLGSTGAMHLNASIVGHGRRQRRPGIPPRRR